MRKVLSGFSGSLCLRACVTALLTLVPPAGFAQGRVEVNFELPHSSVTANEPVYVRISVQNGLEEGIVFSSNLDSRIELWVTEPGGSTVHVRPVAHGGLVQVSTVPIPPESSGAASALLNELYKFKKPGDYRLKVKLTASIRTDSRRLIESVSQDSQELRLSVLPRDPQRLEEVCKALAKAASGYSDYAALKEAATALSYVEDPVAVPYLQQVMAEHNFVSGIAVRGLVRIGSPEALKVLESNLDTPDPMLKMQIQGAIQEIKTGVHPQIMD